MVQFKKIVQQTLKDLPRSIVQDLLARKILEAGVEMPPEVSNAFVQHILSGQENDFVWDDGQDDKVLKIQIAITEEDHKEVYATIDRVLEEFPDTFDKISTTVSETFFRDLQEQWPIQRAIQQEEFTQFRERLTERWHQGLSLLHLLLASCRELGYDTWKRHSRSKAKKHAYRRWVLGKLQARACQIANEIICLMENGFADGALARWRTLHEISVVAILVSENDEDLAERYILHDSIESKRQMDEYERTEVPLGSSPIGKRVRASIEKECQVLLDRYGRHFARPYGWAAKYLNDKNPTFKKLEAAAGRDGMGTYYKLASFNVHADSRSLFFNLSSMGDRDVVLSGPSNAGLLEPGENTAHSLALITSLYIRNDLDLDQGIQTKCLLQIRDDAVLALRKATRSLIRDEKKRKTRLDSKRKKVANMSSPT